MMLHQLHLCFLLAILLLLCPKTGKAIEYEKKEIDASVNWKQAVYKNENTEKVIQEITHTTGMLKRNSDTRMIEATHRVGVIAKKERSSTIGVGVIAKGELFAIVSLEISYTFEHKSNSVTMLETEIYESLEIKTIVTIPPRSTLTRWELITDVAGTKIGNRHYIDVLNDTQRPTSTPTCRATVLVGRRINYGHTRIRIKHLDRDEYVTVTKRKNWPAAALGHSTRYLFVLCEDSHGLRIKTLNTTHPGYEWAYSSSAGGIYFDWNRQIGRAYDRNVNIQHWLISKEEPLRDGDVVTFKNKHYHDSAMCYHQSSATKVYCFAGREEKWVLETVDAVDSPINNC